MTQKLSHTKVARNSENIFRDVGFGRVILLEAGTGSGKSLFSPTRVWEELRGVVLVLVPSVDVAIDNAERVAELSDYGWKIGVNIGINTGRRKEHGDKIVFATYGSFVRSQSLQNRRWSAILLDESHVEEADVEIARADVHDRLEAGENIFVMELSATMDADKLKSYWKEAGVSVLHHRIDGEGTAFTRDLIEVLTSDQQRINTIVAQVSDRLKAGDRLIMVVQPGLQDVEEVAEKIEKEYGNFVNVYRFHGETDQEDIPQITAGLKDGECGVIVATPRLLTGFNHEDLDTVVTCGRAKYPESDARGSFALRLGDMSQTELIQALGRVGRFKDGRLILCSGSRFANRHPVIVPEVERMSSLPLCLSMVAMGRNPLTTRFCNIPRELRESMRMLQQWKFIDQELDITEEGIQASKLDIRPDLARFLLSVKNNPNTTAAELSAAVVVAACSQTGNVALRNPRTKEGRAIYVPVLNQSSDLYNEAMRFLNIVQMDRKQQKTVGWIFFRGVSRAKAIIYRLMQDLDDSRLWESMGDIFDENEKKVKASKKKQDKLSPRDKAWRRVGKELSAQFGKVIRRLNLGLITAMKMNLYRGPSESRRISGMTVYGDVVAVGNESVVSTRGAIFLATENMITPRNGNTPFIVLVGITKVMPEELVEVAPEMFRIEEAAWRDRYQRDNEMTMQLSVNGQDFHRYTIWRTANAA